MTDITTSGWSRRTALGAAAAAIGGALARPAWAAGQAFKQNPETRGASRIDVHQHLLPPEFVAALDRHGMAAWGRFPWSAESAIATMDRHGIATGILSLSTPGTHLGDDAEARILTRQINERIAGLVRGRPDRFGMFASVPLPDVDGSLQAIAHAYDDLHADGVVLLTNVRGMYVGDPAFEPVMAELNRRNAVVFIHPGPLPGPPAKGIHPTLADFLLDTTRAAINMVQNGIPRRYPGLKIILAHAGGFVPYAAYRISLMAAVDNPKADSEAMLADLSSFYFDTALSGSPTVLPSLFSFAADGHELFGSDWPYCPDQDVRLFTGQLDAYRGIDSRGHHAVNRGNAERLFPRLAGRAGTPVGARPAS